MDEIPGHYLSEITGKKYDKLEYTNHGRGGEVYCKNVGWRMDIPEDEYPYLIIDDPKPKLNYTITPNYDFEVIREIKRCPFRSEREKTEVFVVFYRIKNTK